MSKPLGLEKNIDDIKNADVRRQIRSLAETNREIQESISALEASKKQNNETLKKIMQKSRLSKVVGDGWQAIRTITTRRSIKKELLVQKGVSLDIIEACTETSDTESVSVRSGKSDVSVAVGADLSNLRATG